MSKKRIRTKDDAYVQGWTDAEGTTRGDLAPAITTIYEELRSMWITEPARAALSKLLHYRDDR